MRIIQGLGLGGELPVAATYINEISRAHGRGRFVLLYEIVFPVGLLASNALGAWIVPRFGWQAMYFIGGMPLILFFVLRKLVPESPRWLAERERMADADAAVLAFERAGERTACRRSSIRPSSMRWRIVIRSAASAICLGRLI